MVGLVRRADWLYGLDVAGWRVCWLWIPGRCPILVRRRRGGRFSEYRKIPVQLVPGDISWVCQVGDLDECAIHGRVHAADLDLDRGVWWAHLESSDVDLCRRCGAVGSSLLFFILKQTGRAPTRQ